MCRSLAEGGRRCPGQHEDCQVAAHNGRRRAVRAVRRLRQAGVAANRATEDPPLYWWSTETEPPALSRAAAVKDPTSELWKPRGGLWAASVSADQHAPKPGEGFHTHWTAWRAAEGYGGRGYLTRLNPSSSAVAVHLRTEDDFAAATRRWPRSIDTPLGTVAGFSFEKMRRDGVDVVHVHTGPLTGLTGRLNGWDADSAVWLNPHKAQPGGQTSVAWDGEAWGEDG